MMLRWTFPTLSLLIILSLGSNASQHAATAGNAKRHTPKAIPRRANPFGNQPLSKPSRLSQLVDTLRSRSANKEGKRDPRLGPGPGPDGEISRRNRERRAARLQKRQGPPAANPSSGVATSITPSVTASAAQATQSMNASDPTWILNDVYAGPTFWNFFEFFTDSDPTHGTVTYVNSSYAFNNGLAYTNAKQQIIMKADNTTVLQTGQYRDSVRIQSYKQYTGGLFLLDVERTPFGCGVWPAFWTVNGNWPWNGEIDIYEGVHLSTNNQVTWHTSPGCTLDSNGGFFGVVNTTNCDTSVNSNSGCAVTDQSYSSSGNTLKNIGGGVFAMKWDTTGIAVWFFPRPVVPNDITELIPDPTGWGVPTARLSPDDCDIVHHFQQHVIVFNIAFCGDWAGATYLTSGCPGTCDQQMGDPSNFDNSIWIINNLRVYTNAFLQAGELSGAPRTRGEPVRLGLGLLVGSFMVTAVLFGGLL